MVRNEMIRGRQGRLGGFALVGLLVVVSATVCLSGASALPNEHRCPADDDHKIDMARKLREENNPSFAIICYEEALEHSSTTSDALLGIAEILFELGNYSGAEARLHTRSFLGQEVVIKERFSKKYRHLNLDTQLYIDTCLAEICTLRLHVPFKSTFWSG